MNNYILTCTIKSKVPLGMGTWEVSQLVPEIAIHALPIDVAI